MKSLRIKRSKSRTSQRTSTISLTVCVSRWSDFGDAEDFISAPLDPGQGGINILSPKQEPEHSPQLQGTDAEHIALLEEMFQTRNDMHTYNQLDHSTYGLEGRLDWATYNHASYSTNTLGTSFVPNNGYRFTGSDTGFEMGMPDPPMPHAQYLDTSGILGVDNGYNPPPESRQTMNNPNQKARNKGPGDDSRPYEGETVGRPDSITMAQLLNPDQKELKDKLTIWDNFGQAISHRNAWLSGLYSQSPDHRDVLLVRELCRAMKSTEHAKDNTNMIAPFKSGKKHTDEKIEFTAWMLVVRSSFSFLFLVTSASPLPLLDCSTSHISHRL
jgi:hypothetical protein